MRQLFKSWPPQRARTPYLNLTVSLIALSAFAAATGTQAQELQSFAVLAGSTVTNTGPTTIDGNVGLYPGTAVVGFPPATITNGTIYANNAVALQAQNSLVTAYNVLDGLPSTFDLTGQTLGDGGTVADLYTGGVYNFDTSAQLTGVLTLHGGPDDVYVFQIGTTLTTESDSILYSAIELDGVDPANVFFVVGSSATLGTGTDFQGQILALTSITLQTNATIDCGAAWARNGAVTLDTNVINVCTFEVDSGTFGDVLGPDGSDNSTSVADAIDEYVAGGGTLPLGFSVLGLLTPAQLAAALAQLGGEVSTGVAPAGIQSMDSFISLVLGERIGPSAAGPTGEEFSRPGTVSVMGYWPESQTPAGSAFESFDKSAPASSAWNVWLGAYGGYTLTEGDADVGSHDRTTRDYGVALGFDRVLWDDASVGLAISVGGTSFDITDGFGSGASATAQVAIYGRKDYGPAYVEGVLAYGYSAVTTDRSVTVGGLDKYHAEFSAHDVATRIEAGYAFDWFIPFIAVKGNAFMTPAYSETTVEGASTFALDYDASTVLSASTEVGATAMWDTTFADDTTLALWVRVAWEHQFGGTATTTAGFQALPGTSFETVGATAAADSVSVSAGARLAYSAGLALGASVKGSFAENSQAYGVNATVSYAW